MLNYKVVIYVGFCVMVGDLSQKYGLIQGNILCVSLIIYIN